MRVAPYGEWSSPITPEAVVAAASSPGDVRVDGDDLIWSESRPSEGGRIQLVWRRADGTTADLLPDGWSARTRVHEYGGGAWALADGTVYFSAWDDQRLYRIDLGSDGAPGVPIAITAEPAHPHQDRYADADVRTDLGILVAVREHHPDDGAISGVVNEIVAVPLDGSGEVTVLVSGPDFVSSPRISPDGGALCWLQWNHPSMPWFATELLAASFDATSGTVGPGSVVAGGADEAIIQPAWRDDGVLHFVSDRTEWWNLYRVSDDAVVPVTSFEGEVGLPPWVFGRSHYAFLPDGRVVAAVVSDAHQRVVVEQLDGGFVGLDLPYTEFETLCRRGSGATADIVAVAAGPRLEHRVIAIAPDAVADGSSDVAVSVLRDSRSLPVDETWLSVPEALTFPTGPDGSETAFALYYPPTNPEFDAPEGTAPPLLVSIHGGPTGMTRSALSLGRNYWTSRGFAVVDVNYRGSTGFGRSFRLALNDRWGIADVEDCTAAARHLADRGLADSDRLCIRGGSAGGFTVLAAMTGSDTFAAGANSFGVADLTALALETHKFESRYLDNLIGPYPEAKEIYDARSPINHVDRLGRPLIVFQGLEDAIVPPNQSEMIVDALRAKGVPVAYLAFEGEQHGFRKAETAVAVLSAELAFYGRVLGFTPDPNVDLAIDNLPPESP